MDLTAFRNVCAIWQDGDVLFEIEPTILRLDDGGCAIYVTLTQEQTLMLEPQKEYHAMMRSVDSNGYAVASTCFTGYVFDVRPDGYFPFESQTASLGFGLGMGAPAPSPEQTEDEPVEEEPVAEEEPAEEEPTEDNVEEPTEEPVVEENEDETDE
jgi:hypothetical protein